METTTGFLFIEFLFVFAFNMLIVFYHALGDNLGLAIIVFTLVLKLITVPFTLRQIKSAKQNTEFQKKYKELKNKHKDDKEKLNQELAKLQAEYLPAQLGGCLPTILQLVFFFQVYYVINNILSKGAEIFNQYNYPFVREFAPGETINLNFLGINLGQSASQVGFDNFGAVAPYLALVLLVGITQYLSTRVTSGMSTLPTSGSDDAKKNGMTEAEKKQARREAKGISLPAAADATKSVTSKKESKSSKSDKSGDKKVPEDYSFSEAMQDASKQMLLILPIMTMFISVSFPAGLSLYWTVTSGFVIIQQLIVNRIKVRDWVYAKLNLKVD